MAKKTFENDSGGKFSDRLDYDSDFNPGPRRASGQVRQAITEMSGTAYTAAKSNFSDVDKWKQAIAEELPPQHKFVYDTYQGAKRTGEELYDQFMGETRPILGEITKKLDDMVDSDSRFKALTSRLKDKFWDAPPSRPNIAQQDNDALERLMSETFGGLDALAEQRHKQSEQATTARAITEQQIGQEQHTELMTVLGSVADSTERTATYLLQAQSKVARKQLELQFRSFLIGGRTLEHNQRSHAELMEQMKALVTNTGLPEYAKIERGERFKEMLRDRAMDGIQNALFGKESAVGQLMGRFKTDVKQGLDMFKLALEQASSGLDMASAMVGPDSGMTPFESLGMMLGGEIGSRTRNAILKPIMDRLRANPEFNRKGYNVGQLMRDPRLLFDLLENNPSFKGMLEGQHGTQIEDMMTRFRTYLNPQAKHGKFGSGVNGLMQPGIMTERLNKVQTDVIPGYLARILQQVTSLVTHQPAPLLRYDFGSNSFVSHSGMGNKVSKMVREYNEKSSYTDGALNRADTLLEELGLEKEDRNSLAAVLSIMARSRSHINGGDISKFAEYSSASNDEKRILERINSFAGFNKDAKTAGTMYRIRESTDTLRGLGDNMSGFIRRMIDEGNADLLVEDGLIEPDPNNPGGYRTLSSRLERLQRNAIYSRTVDSDINLKGRVKRIDKNRALSGIRKMPVSAWTYKGTNRRHVGPMAQDVKHQFGDEMAPNGEQIDLVSMNGATVAAVQALADRVEAMGKDSNSERYLGLIARATGVGELPNVVADSKYTLIDYAHMQFDMLDRIHSKIGVFSLPGVNFKNFELDGEVVRDNAKKFVDPLIRTGNKYIDGLQSVMFSAIQDGFEGSRWLYGKGKQVARKGKENLIDRPFNFIMDVLMRNETEIKDRAKFLYKKSVEAAGKAIDFGTSILTEKIPSAIKATWDLGRRIREGAKRIVNPPRDVFRKDDTEPALRGERMRRGFYVDETGKEILGIDDLMSSQGNIRDIGTGMTVLTQSELADGVYDQNGVLLRTTGGMFAGLAAAGVQGAIGLAKKGFEWMTTGPSIFQKGKDVFQALRSGVSTFFKNGIGMDMFGTDARLLRLTAQIRDLLAIGKPRNLVAHVYGRDLRKHPLEGMDFLSALWGDKLTKKLMGAFQSQPNAPTSGSGGGGGNNPFVGPMPQGFNPSNAAGNLLSSIPGILSSYNSNMSFGQNAKNMWNQVTGNRASSQPGFVGPQQQSMWNQTKSTYANNPLLNSVRGRLNNKFGGSLNRLRNFGQGLYNRFLPYNGPSSSLGDQIDMFDDPQAAASIGPQERPTLARRLRNTSVGRRFGRMSDRLYGSRAGRGLTNFANRARGAAGRFVGGVGGVGSILGAAARGVGGIGSWLLGGSDPIAPTITTGGDLHKDTGPSNISGIRENNSGQATFWDADGDGMRDNGSTRQLERQDEERRIQRAEENDKIKESQERAAELLSRNKREEGFLGKILAAAMGLFGFLKGGLGAVFGGLGGLAKMAGGLFTKGAALAKGALAGAGRLARVAKPVLGGVISGASRVLGATAIVSAATGGVGGALVGAAALAARVALGPVGLGLTAAWYAGKFVYNRMTRNNVDDFGRVRMYQYGLTDSEDDKFHYLLELEDYFREHVSWNREGPNLNSRSIDYSKILDIFEVDKSDTEAAQRLGDWLENRFKPFFFNALAAAREADPKARYFDVSNFDREKLEKLCSRLEFPGGPYSVSESPIPGVTELATNPEGVKPLVEKLRTSKKAKGNKATMHNNAVEESLRRFKDEKDRAKSEKEKDLIAANTGSLASSLRSDKTKSEQELLTKQRESAEGRARLAVQAAAKGKSFASNYRDLDNKVQGSDDGGQQATIPSEGSDGSPAMKSLPLAPGAFADPSAGLEGLILGRGVNIDNLNPTVKQHFMAMAAEYYEQTGKKLRVTDGWRSTSEQKRLYASMPRGRAARPGFSLHEFGAALDISSEDANSLETKGLLRKYGFTRPVGGEPWHLEPAGIQGRLKEARASSAFIDSMMAASAGRGGGGIATMSGVKKYSRNDSYAMRLFTGGASAPISVAETNNAQGGVPTPKGPSVTVGDFGTMASVARFSANAAKLETPTNFGEGEKAPAALPTGNKRVEATKAAIAKYAAESGNDPAFMQVVAGMESSMGTNTNSGGSAQGPFQFMPGTWKEQMGKNGARYGIEGASRNDLRASTLLAGEYFKKNEVGVSKVRGENFDIVDRYFTHMLGPSGAVRFAKMGDDEVAANKFSKAAADNPNVFYTNGVPLTVGQVRTKQMAKVQNVAKTYGINIDHLLGKANQAKIDTGRPGFSPHRPMLERGELGQINNPGVRAGNPNEQVETFIKENEASYTDQRIMELNRREILARTPLTKPTPPAPPVVQPSTPRVSGVEQTSKASKLYEDEMIRVAKDSLTTLQSIDTGMKALLDLYSKGGSSASTQNGTKRPESYSTPSSNIDRTRKYGT